MNQLMMNISTPANSENVFQKRAELMHYLSQMITPARFSRFQSVLNERTRYMTIVLEDIFQPQNASAVLRSCDCFGIQDVHIVENNNTYDINPDVVLGANQWLSLFRYNDHAGQNTRQALQSLKDEGYRIVATSPHKKSLTPALFNLNKGKFALCMGTELTGLSDTVMDFADEFLHVPMVGFTESLNISVTAAILMQVLTTRMKNESLDKNLSEEEKQCLMIQWLLYNTQLDAQKVLDRFARDYGVDVTSLLTC